MNNLKIVYKKPTEYDNSTISISYTDSSTNSDIVTEPKTITESNIKNLNQDSNIGITESTKNSEVELKKSLENEISNIVFSDDEINNLVFVLKKNIMSLTDKNEIIKYIDNFFKINKLNEEVKNKILMKLNESVNSLVKSNSDSNLKQNDIKEDTKNINTLQNKKTSVNNPNGNSTKILGLEIGLWGIICIIIILLILYMKKRN